MWNNSTIRKPLPSDVKNCVRSGTIKPNSSQDVEEMVHSNSNPKIGKSISTRDFPRSMHSRVAIREAKSTDASVGVMMVQLWQEINKSSEHNVDDSDEDLIAFRVSNAVIQSFVENKMNGDNYANKIKQMCRTLQSSSEFGDQCGGVSEYWDRPLESAQIPVCQLKGSELTWWPKKIEDALTSMSFKKEENKMNGDNYADETKQMCKSHQSSSEFGDQRGGVNISEYWDRPLESAQIPVCQLKGSELTSWPKKIGDALRSMSFKKEDLKNINFLCQLDRKIFVTKISKIVNGHVTDLLVIFDQHAAHERVLLEALTNGLYCEIGGQRVIYGVTKVFSLELSDADISFMHRCRINFFAIGIVFEVTGVNTVQILQVPKVLADKAQESKENPLQYLAILVQSLIDEQIKYYADHLGTFPTIPKMIFNILCSNACHKAIKFGDSVEPGVCQDILRDLSDCKLPFQCAHGRPVLFPVMNLQEFRAHAESTYKNLSA